MENNKSSSKKLKRKLKDKKLKTERISHDLLFKKVLDQPILCRQFLEEFLPNNIKELINISSVKSEKDTYVEDSLKHKLSDVVLSVKLKDKYINKCSKITDSQDKTAREYDSQQEVSQQDTAFIYCLLEHQSSSDHWIALRLWKYTLLLLEKHAKKKNKLPMVIPMVVYNGKAKYSAPMSLFDLFLFPDLAKQALGDEYRLIDLNAMSDDDINYENYISFFTYIMKHIFERDTIAMVDKAMKKCQNAIIIDKGENYLLTRLILWYTDSKVPHKDKETLERICADNLPINDTNKLMKTIADVYIEEGYNKGVAQGISQGIERGMTQGIERGMTQGIERGMTQEKLNIAMNMLKAGSDEHFVSIVTNLPIEDLRKLKNKL